MTILVTIAVTMTSCLFQSGTPVVHPRRLQAWGFDIANGRESIDCHPCDLSFG
jgi:hypothetical protein